MSHERDKTLDLMKAITIVLVVIGHATRMYTPSGAIDVQDASRSLGVLSGYIYSFHMPAFMAVSGAVFSLGRHSSGWKGLSVFVRTKTRRLLIPYLVFGTLWVAPAMWVVGLAQNPIKYVGEGILLSLDPRHLWFLLALFIISVACWMVRRTLDSHPLIVLTAAMILYIGHRWVPSVLQLSSAARFLVFFVLGYIAQRQKEVLRRGTASVVLLTVGGVVWVIAASVGMFDLLPHSGKIAFLLSGVSGAFLLYAISAALSRTSLERSRVFEITTRDGYGVYLFHPMIIYFWFWIVREVAVPPVANVVLVSVCSFIISVVLTELVRRIGMQRILGES